MSSNLVRTSHDIAIRNRGSARATADVDFSLREARIPTNVSQSLTGGETPQQVITNPSRVIKRNGVFLEVRQTAFLMRKNIQVVTLQRPLAPRGDGKFSPQGEWSVGDVDSRDFIGNPRLFKKQAGELPVPGDERSVSPGARPEVAHGQYVAGFLPTKVQDFLAAQAPAPHYVLGNLWSEKDGRQARQTLELIWLNHEYLVSIEAKRAVNVRRVGDTARLLDAIPWDISQMTVKLDTRKQIAPLSNNDPFSDISRFL